MHHLPDSNLLGDDMVLRGQWNGESLADVPDCRGTVHARLQQQRRAQLFAAEAAKSNNELTWIILGDTVRRRQRLQCPVTLSLQTIS